MVLRCQQGSKLRSFQLLPALPLGFFALVNKLEREPPMVCYNRSPFFPNSQNSLRFPDDPLASQLKGSVYCRGQTSSLSPGLCIPTCPLLPGSWASAESRSFMSLPAFLLVQSLLYHVLSAWLPITPSTLPYTVAKMLSHGQLEQLWPKPKLISQSILCF